MKLSDKRDGEKLTFRWRYIALPVAVLAASLMLTAVLYSRLPAELAYHFTEDGLPDRWMGRTQFILVALVPQALLTLVAAVIAGVMTMLSSRLKNIKTAIKLEHIISFMGNVLSLPEMVLAFFMLDVFLFHALNVPFVPIWALGLIIMLIGGTCLAIFFFRAFRESRRATK